ncbi:hypothetical protein D3H55_16510 [Bacillus salacetis]|uniref:DUF2325 domain-containing protein n=1 Tax=Bacillus salacetis TaxID=2315464 RepID=A0A3A1QSY6_9BACI|nr:hypothetical protein [Bacillus salacetis]RIW30728.1 hypothetical protein D3H55_16510 [Bacillus salacetis]
MDFRSQKKSLTEKLELKKQERSKRTATLLRQVKKAEGEKARLPLDSSCNRNDEKERKLRKQLQSQLRKLQKRQEEQKRFTKQLQKDLMAVRDRESVLKQENWELRRELHETGKHQMEKQQALKAQLDVETDKRIQAERVAEQLQTEKLKKNKSGNKLADLANQVKHLRASNQEYRQKLENYDLLKDQEYGGMKQDIDKLSKELDQYKLEEKKLKDPSYLVKAMKENLTPAQIPELLNVLETFINLENLRYFYRGKHNVFHILMRRSGLLKHRSRKMTERGDASSSTEEERLGYLVEQRGEWLFVDLAENEFPFKYPLSWDMQARNESPARAVIVEGKAVLTKLFTLELPDREEKGSVLPIKTKTRKRTFAAFGNYHVLLIGARFLSDYKVRLENHGCTVTIHNPYEENYDLLSGKLNQADVILVCEKHVPHTLWGHIDRTEEKVSILKNDSRDLVAAHAYWTLERCGLV